MVHLDPNKIWLGKDIELTNELIQSLVVLAARGLVRSLKGTVNGVDGDYIVVDQSLIDGPGAFIVFCRVLDEAEGDSIEFHSA